MLQDTLPISTRQKLYTPDRLPDDSADICLTLLHFLRYTITMAQDYDNLGKSLWTDHAVDLSRFVLGEENVEVLEDLDTEQQTVIARQTDITKRVRVNNREAILHVELQLRDSTDKPMWARNAQYQGYLVGEHQMQVYSNVIYFHPNAGRNDPGGYTYSWNGYEHTNRFDILPRMNSGDSGIVKNRLRQQV